MDVSRQEFDIRSKHTRIKVIYGKQYDACCYYSPPGYRKELGGTCAITSPARFVICVNGGIDDVVLLVNITSCLIRAGSEDREIPVEVARNVSFIMFSKSVVVRLTRRIAFS
jgi:hypothetical protein